MRAEPSLSVLHHSHHTVRSKRRKVIGRVDLRPGGIFADTTRPHLSASDMPRYGRSVFPVSSYQMPQACQQRDTRFPLSALRLKRSGASRWSHLLIKPLNPPIQILNLILIQILTVVQRPIEILRQHVLIERLTGQTPRRISASKVLIRPTRSVEIPAR